MPYGSSWMPSIQTNMVPTILRVLIQATQHEDDTTSWVYLLFVLFRVLQTKIVSTVLQVLIQATQHKDDTPSQAYLLPVLFRVLHQAQALPFPNTMIPGGYSWIPYSRDSILQLKFMCNEV